MTTTEIPGLIVESLSNGRAVTSGTGVTGIPQLQVLTLVLERK